ncbi:MAG: dienelactone hydrolase family protein [bacterium]
MSDLQRYIVEEWAEEYREGRLHRREFLRRTILLAGGAALAIPVLQSLGVSVSPVEVADAASAPPPATAQAPGITVPPDDPAIASTGMVSFASGAVAVQAYLAKPRASGAVPGVIVIHENRGLLEHFKDLCRRFAKIGYAALAVDLASAEGGTAKFTDSAQVTAILGRTSPEQLVAMLNAGVRHLQSQPGVRRDRIGAMGFCFGGGMTWRLATQNAELKAAAPFYGSNPPLEDVPKIKAAVLTVYGALDQRINAGIPAVREAMRKAGVVHEIVIYPNAAHAFFNDTGANYNATAAREAWAKTVAWFDRYLKQ